MQPGHQDNRSFVLLAMPDPTLRAVKGASIPVDAVGADPELPPEPARRRCRLNDVRHGSRRARLELLTKPDRPIVAQGATARSCAGHAQATEGHLSSEATAVPPRTTETRSVLPGDREFSPRWGVSPRSSLRAMRLNAGRDLSPTPARATDRDTRDGLNVTCRPPRWLGCSPCPSHTIVSSGRGVGSGRPSPADRDAGEDRSGTCPQREPLQRAWFGH